MQKINFILYIGNLLDKILFYKIFNFPILIILLVIMGLYFSFYLKFPNIIFFKKSLKSIYSNNEDDTGIIKSKQSFFTSLSSIIGIGCIAGVATAIKIGGVGSIFWMIITSFFSMNTAFAETILATKYKIIDKKNKRINCAPISYIKLSLQELNFPKLGIILSFIYGFMYFIGLIGSQVYQIKEAMNLVTDISFFKNYEIFITIIFNIIIILVVCGGITKIANFLNKFLPTVCGLYMISVFVIIIFNIKNLHYAIITIITEAFKSKAVFGGLIGTISTGIKRAIYSNEAGLGSSTTPYAASESRDSIKQALIGSLNPFFTGIMCFLTGMAIVITKSHLNNNLEGILLTKSAFATISIWFPNILTIVVSCLALSVCISSTFNALNIYLTYFNKKTIFIFIILQFITVISSAFLNLNEIIDSCDVLYMSIAVPNIICLFMCRNIIKKSIKTTE